MRFGNVVVDSSGKGEAFAETIAGLNLESPIIIKPNWGFSQCYTEAKVLDWILSAVKGVVLVVESYGWARTEDAIREKRAGSKTRSSLRKSDRWFLDYSGIGKVLEKHGVEYLNITEAVWAGQTVKPETMRQLVEAKYPPIHNNKLYSTIPNQLYELRGGTMLSLAKIRSGAAPIDVSLSMKNLFGMIPNPNRMKFHGKDNSLLNQNIVDINKIYRSLFTVKGIIEGVFTASKTEDDPLDPIIKKNLGFVFACEDTLELDVFVSVLMGKDPSQVGQLTTAAEVFGGWNAETVTQAQQSRIRIF